MDSELTMADGPGKFEGELLVTELAWEVTMNGGSDEDYGRYSILRNGSTIFLDNDPFGEDFGLSDADLDFLRDSAGCILFESDYGFVYGSWFDSADELESAWEMILDEDLIETY